jgi:hypothetical protein
MGDEQVVHVVRVLLLDRQNPFQHTFRARIVLAEEADQLTVVINGDAFGNQGLPGSCRSGSVRRSIARPNDWRAPQD